MILYHFTEADLVAVIQAEGLKPGDNSWGRWVEYLPPKVLKEDVVWLTADDHLTFTLKRSLTHRFMLKMPSWDRRLISFAKTLRQVRATAKSVEMDEEGFKRCMAFYVYRGPIPLDRITRIDDVTHKLPPAYSPPT